MVEHYKGMLEEYSHSVKGIGILNCLLYLSRTSLLFSGIYRSAGGNPVEILYGRELHLPSGMNPLQTKGKSSEVCC